MDECKNIVEGVRIKDLFDVRSGDYHAVKELDPGPVPLISCGDTAQGLVGYFDIPASKRQRRCLTVAYNGSWPLTAKFHPYEFGAKDDVAVLVPRTTMSDAALLYIAAVLNGMTWRYSYGRKCFAAKLRNVAILVPVVRNGSEVAVDEAAIERLVIKSLDELIPQKGVCEPWGKPAMRWREVPITEVLDLRRGDFHSLSELAPGEFMTVSRVTDDNGVAGYYERPDRAAVYSRGHITVSTVGGDAFVQLADFLATDNVIVCRPRRRLRASSVFFIAFSLNRQKWRYSYGRQCYRGKLEQVRLHLPVTADGELDEDAMACYVRQVPHWSNVARRFPPELDVWVEGGAEDPQLDLPLDGAGAGRG